jgi:multiple sugar transport system permease protein
MRLGVQAALVDGALVPGDVDWSSVMAASVIYSLPVAVVFVFLRKYLMTGTTAGAVKG